MIQKKLLIPIEKEKISSPVAYGFGVEQGESELRSDLVKCFFKTQYFLKLRPCFDFRLINLFCPVCEKMRLLSHRCLISISKFWMQDSLIKPISPIQSKKDIQSNVVDEKERINSFISSNCGLLAKSYKVARKCAWSYLPGFQLFLLILPPP